MSLKTGKLVCNIYNTQYPIVSEVVKTELKWRVSDEDSEDWDVMWTDSAVSTERLSKMKHFQRINHFPGMYLISRKNYLALNLKKLQKQFPFEFNFFPKTWIFPCDLSELKSFTCKGSYFIVKPEASCQGKGIFLTNKLEELNPMDRFVVQEYIANPFLIDGFKFDLRIYVLVTSCEPLRIFVFDEGLTRLASRKYCKPNKKNCEQAYMHLTNYAINKLNKNFINNSSLEASHIGHKRSLTSTLTLLSSKGYNTADLLTQIDELIIKTLCTIQPNLSHHYLTCQPDDLAKAMCFEILGFDILIDEFLKPFLLEVNHSPSFNTDSPLDTHIKTKLIKDSLKLAWISQQSRADYYKKLKEDLNKRVFCGKFEKITKEEKEAIGKEQQRIRDEYEEKNLGGFRKIFPVAGCERFEILLKAAQRDWFESTGMLKAGNIAKAKIAAKSLSMKKVSIVKRNLNFNESAESSFFCRLAQPVIRKVFMDTHKVLPGVVYEDKKLYKFELPKQVEISMEMMADRAKTHMKRFRNLQHRRQVSYSDMFKLIKNNHL